MSIVKTSNTAYQEDQCIIEKINIEQILLSKCMLFLKK